MGQKFNAQQEQLVRQAIALRDRVNRLQKQGNQAGARQAASDYKRVLGQLESALRPARQSYLPGSSSTIVPSSILGAASGAKPDPFREFVKPHLELPDYLADIRPQRSMPSSQRLLADEVQHNKVQTNRIKKQYKVRSNAERENDANIQTVRKQLHTGQATDVATSQALLQKYLGEKKRFDSDPYYKANPKEVQRIKALIDLTYDTEGTQQKLFNTGIDLADAYGEYRRMKLSGLQGRKGAWVANTDMTAMDFSDASVKLAKSLGISVTDLYRLFDKKFGKDVRKTYTEAAKAVTKSMENQRGISDKDLLLRDEGGLLNGQSDFSTAVQERTIRNNRDLAMTKDYEDLWRYARDGFNEPATIILQTAEGSMNGGHYRKDDELLPGEKLFRSGLDMVIQELATRGIGKGLKAVSQAKGLRFLAPIGRAGAGVNSALDKMGILGSGLRVGANQMLGAAPDIVNDAIKDARTTGKDFKQALLDRAGEQAKGMVDLSWIADPNLGWEDKILKGGQQGLSVYGLKSDVSAGRGREVSRKAREGLSLNTLKRDGQRVMVGDLSDKELSVFRDQTREHLSAPVPSKKKQAHASDLKKIEAEISRREKRTEVDHWLEDARAKMKSQNFTEEQIDAQLSTLARQAELAHRRGQKLPGLEVADKADAGTRPQTEGFHDGSIKNIPKFTKMKDLLNFLQGFSKEKAVFPEGIENVSFNEGVKRLKKETHRELKAIKGFTKKLPEFFRGDITEKANPQIHDYMLRTKGRKATDAEIKLYHIIGAVTSPARNPELDSDVAFKIFDRYMTTGDLSARIKTPDGQKRIEAANVYLLDRVRRFIQKEGRLSTAMDFLTQHQTPEQLRAKLGDKVFDERKANEYFDSNDGGAGIFALSGAKLPAYALDRLQELKFVAKDRWHARVFARLAGEPLLTPGGKAIVQPWGLTEQGLRKRKMIDHAWGEVAKELGVERGDVAQWMWELEHKLYDKLGVKSPVYSISDGVRKGIEDVLAGKGYGESGDPVLKDILPQRAKAGEIKGTFNPKTWLVQLINGKADLSTSIHEMSGHWFENILRNDPQFGPALQRIYGDVGTEKFARHVEQYLMTGKAPVKALREVYSAIGKSMKQIYRGQRLEKMPAEVRSIFDSIHSVGSSRVDRLVQEFNARHPQSQEGPLIRARSKGVSDEERRREMMETMLKVLAARRG